MAMWSNDPVAPPAAGKADAGGHAWSNDPVAPQVSPQQRYAAALAKVRQNEFPQMNDEQWAGYSKLAFPPYNLNDQVEQGQTFGLGDEISAGMGALGNQVRNWTGGGGPNFGQSFGDLNELEDARKAIGTANNGWLGTAASIIGGLSTMGPGGGSLDAAATAGRDAAWAPVAAPVRVAAPAAVTKIAPPLWQQAFTGAAVGVPVGAATGFASTDGGMAERIPGAEWGGAVGGAVGAATPYVAAALSGAYRHIAEALARQRAAASTGLDPSVAEFTQHILGPDLNGEGARRMAEAGPEGMIADTGPNARSALDTAIQKNGEAGQMAREAIDARVGRDSQAVNDAMDASMGRPQGLNEMRQNIAAASAPERASTYDAAYATPIDWSTPRAMQIEDALKRVDPSIIDKANALMRRNGEKSAQIMATIADDGSVSYKTMPDVRQIDYITRALNTKASTANAGVFGGMTPEAASYSNLAKQLRGTLRVEVPAYDAALKAASDPAARSAAVKFGYTALNGSTTRDDVALELHGMSDEAKAGMAQGIRASVNDALGNVSRTVMDGDVPAREAIAALRKFSTPAARDKLTMILGEEDANRFFDELDRAAHSFDLRAAVSDNSRTFARQNLSEASKRFAEGGENPLQELAQGSPLEAGKKLVQFATGETSSAQAARSEAFNRQIAEVLLLKGPRAQSTMAALQALHNRSAAANDIADALLHSINGVGRAGIGPAVMYRRSGQPQISGPSP